MQQIKLSLLDTQVELIEKALILYLEKTQEKYNYRKIAKTKQENLEISLVRDTWCEINLIYREFQLENNSTETLIKVQKISWQLCNNMLSYKHINT